MVGDGRVGIITNSLSFNDLMTARIEVLNPLEAKGLEFDHVIVVEPGAWVDETEEGYQLLYVALTRPTKTLVIAHSGALPKRLLTGKKKKKVGSNELADSRKGNSDLQRATPF